MAEQLERLPERRRVEAQRARRRRRAGRTAGRRSGHRRTRRRRRGRSSASRGRRARRALPDCARATRPAVSCRRSSRGVGGRPARLGDPAARALVVARAGRHGVLQPRDQHRLLVDPVLDALQPAVVEAHALAERAHRRRRDAVHRIVVPPGPDERAPRHVEVLEQPERRVGVAVGPAGDRHHGAADGRVVLARRAVPPVVVAQLVGEPRLEEVGRALEALAPLLAPAVAHDRGIGRQRVPREHAVGPLRHVHRDHEPAAVVHVVGVAVVARVDADHGAERRRRARRELQAVEAAPRGADDADVAVAPGLRGDPRDDLEAVEQLLLGVLVLDDPARVAGAADVDADRGVAMTREPAHLLVVARLGAVAQAVGQVLEDRRHASRRPPGSHSRAARRVPSESSIHSVATTRTGNGRSSRTRTGIARG